MWGLAHYGQPTDYYWDVVSGISAGAINTAGTAGWSPSEVVEMTEWLSEEWYSLRNSDVWLWRNTGVVDAVFKEPSLLNDDPALEEIQYLMSFKDGYHRRVSVGTVDANTGEFVEFNQANTSYSDFA